MIALRGSFVPRGRPVSPAGTVCAAEVGRLVRSAQLRPKCRLPQTPRATNGAVRRLRSGDMGQSGPCSVSALCDRELTHDSEQLPVAGHPLELMGATLCKLDSGPRDEIGDSARNKDFTRVSD